MTAREQKAWQAFVAYARVDQEWTECLAENLHRLGIAVFYDGWEISAGDVFVTRVDEGLARSQTGLLVVSPEALIHPWVGELYAAILNAAVQRNGKLIPVILRAARLPPMLASRHPIDFTGLSGEGYKERVRQLAKAIGGLRPPRPQRGEPLREPPPVCGVRGDDDEMMKAHLFAALKEIRSAVAAPAKSPSEDVGSQLVEEGVVHGVGALAGPHGLSGAAKKLMRGHLRKEKRVHTAREKQRRTTSARHAATSLDKALEKHGSAFAYTDIKTWRTRARKIKSYQRAETIYRHLVQLLDEIEEHLTLE